MSIDLKPKLRLKLIPRSLSEHGLRVLDLFCGCGGLSTGLIQAGCQIVAGIDHWDTAVETFRLNHPSSLSICQNLKTYAPRDFAQQSGYQRGDIDVIVGGPPCQGFSIAGKRQSNDPRNSLFMEFVKYLDYFQPRGFMMENVMGIMSMKNEHGDLSIDIISSCLSIDYNIKIFKLYASDYQVPQNRRRVIVYGLRKDLERLPSCPATVSPRPPVSSVLLSRELIDQSYYLSQRALDGIRAKKQRSSERGHGFGAQMLKLDQPSYTIPSRYYKDGYDALVEYSPTEVRRLTELEIQRIQSFPEDYKFSGTRKDIIIQIGNAVPCRFAYHLGKHLKLMLT